MPYATREQIAHLLDLSTRMVNKHVKEDGMPKASRGEYDMFACVRWYIGYLRGLAKDATQGDETERQSKARLNRAKADIAELELSRARGEVVRYEIVKFAWGRVVMAFRSKMLALPTKLPQRLIGLREINQAKKLLDDEIYEALSELGRAEVDISELQRTEKARSVDDGADDPTSKAHRKRVGRQKQNSK